MRKMWFDVAVKEVFQSRDTRGIEKKMEEFEFRGAYSGRQSGELLRCSCVKSIGLFGIEFACKNSLNYRFSCASHEIHRIDTPAISRRTVSILKCMAYFSGFFGVARKPASCDRILDFPIKILVRNIVRVSSVYFHL